jgi:hypothetical protein
MIGDYEVFETTCFHERYSILNAYYLPGAAPGSIYDSVSPVNTFRIVFNLYLGTDLELLPDRQYYSPVGAMFRFTDVTARTAIVCPVPEDGSP